MRTVTRAVRGGATSTVVIGALVAGAGLAPADAAPVVAPDAPATSTSTDTTDIRLKVGTQSVRRVSTPASRAYRVLERQGVSVDRDDKVLVVRDGKRVYKHGRRALRTDDMVRVVRFTTAVRTHRKTTQRPLRVRKVTTLKPGVRKVVRHGQRGVDKVRVRIEFKNGKRIGREVVGRKAVRKARPRIVKVGQRARTVPGTGHLNWGALARCESGGNPRAVNPAGYYGLYQFDVGTWRSVGGQGMPHQAGSKEQTYRAKKLYAQRGRSPWPNCGRYL